MGTVFISHAAADKPLVDGFVDLLQLGCSLAADEVFCTSVEGAGIAVGEDFVRWIKEHLVNVKLVVLLITPNYLCSRFCVAEMGAAWSLEKDVFPIVLPNLSRDVGGVLLGRQIAMLESSGLDHLRDRLASYNGKAAGNTSRWSIKKDEFLQSLPERLKDLPSPAVVDRDVYEEAKAKTAAAMDISRELSAKIRRLETILGKVEALKDRHEVERAKASSLPNAARYEELRGKVVREVANLTIVEVRWAYAYFRNETWRPTYDSRNEYPEAFRMALESDWVVEEDTFGEKTHHLNWEHPRYANLSLALQDFQGFIEKGLSAEEKSILERQKGCLISLANRQFWEEALYRGERLPD